ncbi:acyl-CoA dehydrogenase family protein [Methylobacterium sp. JK268]
MSGVVLDLRRGGGPPPDPRDAERVLATARDLAADFAARAERHDREGSFPHENVAALRAAGFLGLTVPRHRGGGGAGLGQASRLIGTLAAGDAATALVLAMQWLQHAQIARAAWPAGLARRLQREAVEDGALINALRVEPELGTPARGGLPATLLRRDGEGWRLTGRKIYATGAPALAWGAVFARTDEADPRVGIVLVPMRAPGVRIEETWDPLGLRASGSHDVVFEEVALPLDHAVDLRVPAGWAAPDPVTLAWSAALIAALYDGVARAAQTWLLHHLAARSPANLGAPLASLPRFQEAAGENERLLAVNARLIASLARDVDAGAAPPAEEGGHVKVTVTENAVAVVQRAVELTGNPGLARRNPLERHLRDVLCARIHTPQGDAVRMNAGRRALAALTSEPGRSPA